MRPDGRAILGCILALVCCLAFVQTGAQCSSGSPAYGINESSAVTTPSPTSEAQGSGDPAAASATPIVLFEAHAALPPVAPSAEPIPEAPAPPPPTVAEPDAMASDDPTPVATARAEATPEASALQNNQIVVYYGSPVSPDLGILGGLDPDQAADDVSARATTYDALNGDVRASGALDLIYSLAQDEPTENGLYLRYLPDDVVDRYIDVARDHGLELFLDVQVGRARVIDEVKNLEQFLENPHVHVAIDPEYAVGPDGVPIATPGRISGDEINEVQQYLSDLVKARKLPPKMLVVHQYMEDTIVDDDRVATVDGVDFVLNMDAVGEVVEKKRKYEFFSAKGHSKHESFNVFLNHDDRVLSEDEILGLSPAPSLIFYQ